MKYKGYNPQTSARKRAAYDDPSTTLSTKRKIDDPTHFMQGQHNRRHVLVAGEWCQGNACFSHTSTFNVYQAILKHPNLFFQFALRLPLQALKDLYAVDKEFHYRLNKYSVSLMHDYAKYHAPLSSYIFSWSNYPDLCISDPMLKPMDGRQWLARDVPGFKWIGMVQWRETVVRNLLTEMALEKHRMPESAEETLMKYWALMEKNTTPVRRALLRDERIWKDEDLLNVLLLRIKLDMRFNHCIDGTGLGDLSFIMLTQKSLSSLWRLLTGRHIYCYNDAADVMIETVPVEELDTATHTWLDNENQHGIPSAFWGIYSKQGWRANGGRMDSPLDLIVDEGFRRGLGIHKVLFDFFLFGHVDSATGRSLGAPRLSHDGHGVIASNVGRSDAAQRRSLKNNLMPEVCEPIIELEEGIGMDLC